MLDKIKGALFGFAIGDALGGTTEFLTKREISDRYGVVKNIVGGGVWNLEKGETTDDTAMTLAVGWGILKDPQNPICPIGDGFLKWYASGPKDIGIIIRTVLSHYKGDWFEDAKKAHFDYLNELSAGNGSLMRCLPVALAYNDLDEVEANTRKQSKMTHFDSLADEACIIYNRIAYQVLHGKELKKAIKDEIQGTIYETALTGEKPTCLPDGFVVNTMKWVLYWLLTSDSYLDVVIGAANEGHDTDTVAAIAGGLAGLACGFDAIPREYSDLLLVKDELLSLALELNSLRSK
ncbi:ADP-ribosylglycohydrolase family protein [Neobacillus sp. FSL H8-0543]|uniref:ADP-ribosylglycohydrolase family protein n=1 Tax=Neobacillus sp. FSL H8-0543 TaxID=2954672 RepID=UPI0031586F05